MRGWEEVLQSQGLALPTIPQETKDLGEQSQEQAAIATQNAIQHAAEQEAVFRRSQVERFALENHLGQQSFADLERTIAQHLNCSELTQASTNTQPKQPFIENWIRFG
jgi:hypothetical protein